MEFEPRSAPDLFGAAFSLYRRAWSQLIAIAAVIVIPLSLLGSWIEQGASVEDPGSAGLSAVVILVSLITAGLLVVAVTRAVARAAVGVEPTVSESYRRGLASALPVLVASFLAGIAVVGGLVLLVVPGIFLLGRFSVAAPTVVVEGARPVDALRRSFRLVRGRTLAALGLLLLASIIGGMVEAILGAVFQGEWLESALASALAGVLVQPFTAIVIVLLYLDLRIRSEALTPEGLRGELGIEPS